MTSEEKKLENMNQGHEDRVIGAINKAAQEICRSINKETSMVRNLPEPAPEGRRVWWDTAEQWQCVKGGKWELDQRSNMEVVADIIKAHRLEICD